jgi:hypothetical protein
MAGELLAVVTRKAAVSVVIARSPTGRKPSASRVRRILP